ncbi:hypothetical protein [Ferrimonas marina]|uniref:Uncharacterized protein n=1 Tax=Ferrimonas marina TaxID=299255 RepID=A0A1M5YVP6_9GAMM|nr:hypothetical protein [Ferrimonas marina]SHI15613.1 hypothetical protein SAMN02745129_4459 [Ferrimonas marina]
MSTNITLSNVLASALEFTTGTTYCVKVTRSDQESPLYHIYCERRELALMSFWMGLKGWRFRSVVHSTKNLIPSARNFASKVKAAEEELQELRQKAQRRNQWPHITDHRAATRC